MMLVGWKLSYLLLLHLLCWSQIRSFEALQRRKISFRSLFLPRENTIRTNTVRASSFSQTKLFAIKTSLRSNEYPDSGSATRPSVSPINTDVGTSMATKEYNGKRIDEFYHRRPFQVWERLVNIGSPILGWWLSCRWDNITASFQTPEQRQEITKTRARELKEAIVQGQSITFIKSGQALALRPDLLKSIEYVEELSKLQDEVGTFDNDEAMKIIREELGVSSVDEVYEFDPPLPIASASIGQVYRARLRKSPETIVAVKVQRPDALLTVDVDLYILRRIADFIKYYRKLRSNLLGIVDEFGRQLYEELNYKQEAANCEKFQAYYGSIPNIYIPKIYHDYTRRRVLTMEFIDGKKGPWPENGEKMLTIGLQCSVLQLLGTGYFHADPHRGNLLQTSDGKLVYLDFGMMTEISAKKRFAIIGTVLGLVNKDLDIVLRNLNELEFFPPDTNITESIEALNIAIRNATDRPTQSLSSSSSSLNFTKLNANILQIQQKLPVQIPPYYTQIIRSLTILEGLALYVDKDFRLVKGAYPFIIRQVLTNPSPELNELFTTVLVNRTTNRIRWNKLESWMKLSLQADKAMKGNFQVLKAGQNASNLMKAYLTIEDPSDEDNTPSFLKNLPNDPSSSFSSVRNALPTTAALTNSNNNNRNNAEDNRENVQVIGQLLDYLLSTNGKYLREPLIDEIIDLINNIGGTSQNVLSVITNRIIPPASSPPNRQQVLKFIQLLQYLSSVAINQVEQSSSGDGSGSDNGNRPSTSAIRTLSLMASSLQKLLLSSLQNQSEIQPLIKKLNLLFLQIVGKMVEQRSQQTIQEIVSGKRIQSILPAVARILDFFPNL